jgi:uncharacterized protein GlcG (DUF336 family)
VSMSIELARRILEASKQRARELRSPVSIAIVDAGGHLVLFERMMAPYGWATGGISVAKANTAVMFNQSTDAVAQWGASIPGFASSMASMTEGKFIMATGGWPIRLGGATIGGIGVSGGNAPGRDDEIARAGLAVVEAMAPAVPAAPAYPVAPAAPPYTGPSAGTPGLPLYPAAPASTPPSTPAANRSGTQLEFPGSPPPTQFPTPTQHLPSDTDEQFSDNSFNQFTSNKDRQGGFS